jgi:hypothetical protein
MPPAAVSDLDKEAPVAASAHLLLTALSERAAEPSVPGPRAGRAAAEPEGAHLCLLSSEGACSAAPLTSEPPLPDAEPLTSEPPLADAAHLTSEPTSTGAASGV